jgi:hypothetical protein
MTRGDRAALKQHTPGGVLQSCLGSASGARDGASFTKPDTYDAQERDRRNYDCCDASEPLATVDTALGPLSQ